MSEQGNNKFFREPLQHHWRNLWGQITRGLFGVVRILQQYEDADLPGAPTNDLRLAAKQLNELADKVEGKGHADNTFSYSQPRS